MHMFFMFFGIALLFLGLPASIIAAVVFAIKKKKVLASAVCIPASIFAGFIFICIGGYLYGQTDEYKQSVAEKEQSELERLKEETENQENYIKDLESELNGNEKEENNDLEISELSDLQTGNEENKETNVVEETIEEEKTELSELTEEEYKELCEEMYYDDIFFGEDELDGEYIKLHLFLTEKYYFTADDMYSDTFKSYDDKYHMRRDFFKASVLREGENSYVGVGKVNLWFSEDIDIDPNSYKTGEHIIVYAEVISWSNNTWNGYNSITIIPKYIEEE